MALFYKGVGVGTFGHAHDLRATGLLARNPTATPSVSALMNHIAGGTRMSPYISLTRSFGVARDYAINASCTAPSVPRPAHVYELEIGRGDRLEVLDPMFEIADQHRDVYQDPSYHHNGSQSFILGVMDPVANARFLTARPPQPAVASGSSAPTARLTPQLEAFARALRDAEILVVRAIPAACFRNRYDEC